MSDHLATRREFVRGGAVYLASAATGSAFSQEPIPGKTLKVRRVLFLGNSITLHEPAPQIGWTGNWGMAASGQDEDYVHLLLKRMRLHSACVLLSMTRNIAEFERNLEQYPLREKLKAELAFQADLVIVAIGENAAALNTAEDKARYSKAFTALLDELRRHGSPTILVRSCFWADPAKDDAMKTVCQQSQIPWIEIGDLGRDESNAARSERKFDHAGVAGHPGDLGMQRIADRLWQMIEKQPQLWTASQ